jgi:two-component system CheB/CheR fusion protein
VGTDGAQERAKKYQMQDVVGLGGSAGSIEALKTFFSYMPENSGLAFIVVLHLSPKYESSLEVVLQKWTRRRRHRN